MRCVNHWALFSPRTDGHDTESRTRKKMGRPAFALDAEITLSDGWAQAVGMREWVAKDDWPKKWPLLGLPLLE